MENNAVISIEQVIDYIENHLSEKIDLETVSTTVNYSKYH
ncbi:AraC family transcriptional regulator, partial [Sellimonas intestinalis]|nr:AraC family transcriptional regulator [Sellimonas intestinalis]